MPPPHIIEISIFSLSELPFSVQKCVNVTKVVACGCNPADNNKLMVLNHSGGDEIYMIRSCVFTMCDRPTRC